MSSVALRVSAATLRHLSGAAFRAVTPTLAPARHLSAGDRAEREVQLSRALVDQFTALSGDANPVHVDPAAARPLVTPPDVTADVTADVGDDTVVHGALLNGLVSAVMGSQLPGPGTLVARQTLEFPAVCRSSDLVRVAVTLTRVRKVVEAEFSVTVPARGVEVMRGTARLVRRTA